MNYEEWLKTVPVEITGDSFWKMLTQIIRLLLTMVPDQRGYTLHEKGSPYPAEAIDDKPLSDPSRTVAMS